VTGTRERILAAAVQEFSRLGYGGGRIERIAAAANANLRMIYHYFGSKEDLYVAALEAVYGEVRAAERQLRLERLAPEKAMQRLVEFTFDHFLRHPEFVGLLTSENLLEGAFLKRSRVVPELTIPLMEAIRDVLGRGSEAGVFREGIDPLQLFVTLHAVCYLHVSNRYTLSTMFQRDLAAPDFLAGRRAHVVDVILRYLKREP